MDMVDDLYTNAELDCSCPQPCSETTFINTVSQGYWPSEQYKVSKYRNTDQGMRIVC